MDSESLGRHGIDAAYREYIAGKRCVIVGPAQTDTPQPILGAFDVVARLNNALATTTDKTHVLYHNEKFRLSDHVKGERENWLACDMLKQIDWLCSVHNRMAASPNDPGRADKHSYRRFTVPFARFAHECGVRLHFPAASVYRELSQRVGHPNAGTSAIADLLAHGAATVATHGITLFSTGYVPGYRAILAPQGAGHAQQTVRMWHDIGRQREWMRSLAMSEPRFQPGADLKRVLEI